MKAAVCTISTESHLFKSYALLDSVKKYSDTKLFCLVTDMEKTDEKEGLVFHTLNDIQNDIAEKMQLKYKSDKLRWALKSVYVKFLLENGCDQVIYVDNDIFFYSSPDFLFEKLESSSFLLTPHFYKTDITKEQNWFEANFRVGLYNTGFFGANKNAVPILDWWAECCLYNIKKSYWRGLYDDQKYLDLIPVKFDTVEIIKNRGCNLAGWNDETYKENSDSLIFVHFADITMERWGKSPHPLHAYYRKYVEKLRQYKPNYKWEKKRFTRNYWSDVWNYLRWYFFTAKSRKNIKKFVK